MHEFEDISATYFQMSRNEEVVSPWLQAEVDRESPVSCEFIDSCLEACFNNVDIDRYSDSEALIPVIIVIKYLFTGQELSELRI